MAKKAKKLRKGMTQSKMPMKKMPEAPKSTSPNSADTEMNKLMGNKGYPSGKAK